MTANVLLCVHLLWTGKQQKIIPHSSEDGESEVKVWQGYSLLKPLSLAYR
jgi:hypothetical protein